MRVFRTCPHFIKFFALDLHLASTFVKSASGLVYDILSSSGYHASALPESNICHKHHQTPLHRLISSSIQTKRLCWAGSTHDILLEKLGIALKEHDVEEAWEAFNDFRRSYGFPGVSVVSRMITELSYSCDECWLQKAFELVLTIAKEKSGLLQHDILTRVSLSLSRAQMPIPASRILRLMLHKHNAPPVDVFRSVIMHMVKSEVGTYLASNILIEICDCFHRLNAKKSDLAASIKPGTMIFNLVLDACVKTRLSLKGKQIIELMAQIGTIADAHSIILFACIFEMNGERDELKKFKYYVDQVSIPLVHHYRQFYDCLLSLHYKFDDLDAAAALIADIYKCWDFRPIREHKELAKPCLVPIGSHYLREGLKIQVMPELLQKDSVLLMEGKQELVLFKSGKLALSNKALAQLILRYKRNGRIIELSKLLVSIAKELGLLRDDSLCTDVIDACIYIGWLEMAHDIVDDMESTRAPIPIETYMSLLRAYCRAKMLREAKALVNQIRRAGLLSNMSNDMVLSQCISERACESGENDAAIRKFDLAECLVRELKGENTICSVVYELNSAMYFFCKAKMIEDALKTYRRMLAMKIQPTVQTFAYLIQGYSSLELYREITILWGDIKRNMEPGYLVITRELYELLLLNFIRARELCGSIVSVVIADWKYFCTLYISTPQAVAVLCDRMWPKGSIMLLLDLSLSRGLFIGIPLFSMGRDCHLCLVVIELKLSSRCPLLYWVFVHEVVYIPIVVKENSQAIWRRKLKYTTISLKWLEI
ncbi:hypothetical protein Nepgr_008466 [Nepenthes gracilis]|uniref:At1g68980-like TPR repeats domain-containing protein n=1 Tax=Nepenthes gracilis TaxID=150966 RepID=A0AAD3S944_NEPGR|nr:hypothetical protein Nepgr_008466 [Nepenthes gracilis]